METVGRLRGDAELAFGTLDRILKTLCELNALARVGSRDIALLHRTAEVFLGQAALALESVSAPGAVLERPAERPAGRPSTAALALVDVVGGLAVEAMVLPENCRTREEVMAEITGPMLCYVPAWGHFALRAGDLLFHGNVGNVYDQKAYKPVGVKKCRYAACSDASCSYYHDPASHPAFTRSSGDTISPGAEAPLHVRNFFAESFLYQPSVKTYVGRDGRRAIGSAQNLSSDIANLSAKEGELFMAQVAHDIVCAAVLHNAEKRAG
jgi:hypothetical protein